MSNWANINGVITVEPLGKTQCEKRYVLDTILSHLPKVTGSETDMETYVIQRNGYDTSCTHDEFGRLSNLGNGYYGLFETQSTYLIVVCGSLRDRMFEETFKEFNKWLCRLSKRVLVKSVLVRIEDIANSTIINDNYNVYHDMYEGNIVKLTGKSVEWSL